MPMFDFACECGYNGDRYVHTYKDKPQSPICDECGGEAKWTLSLGKGLTFFEEGRGRWIENLADQPVYVTSHAQHKKLMKEHGVELAGSKTGMPGCWT